MSGAMRRMGEYLGLLEDTGRYDDYADGQADGSVDGFDAGYDRYQGRDTRDARDRDYGDETGPIARRSRREVRQARSGQSGGSHSGAASVADLSERRRSAAPAGSVAELSRITTLQPRTYNEARTVGENYRDGTPVIMNLTDMDDADAKRLVDFAAGLIFASHGTIERITNRVFLLSPPNVTVAAEDKVRIVEGGFFNQS